MGVGRVGRNDIDIVRADAGQSGAAPQGSWGLCWAQDWGLVGSRGRGHGKVAVILTGGPALPTRLDGVAFISRSTARGDSGL